MGLFSLLVPTQVLHFVSVFQRAFNLLFFGIANIQLYFNTAKYLSIYFLQISNFFAGLQKRESLYNAITEKNSSFPHLVTFGRFSHYKYTTIFLSMQ